MTVLIDSSGWIEYFASAQKAKKYSDYIEKANKLTTITPTIVLFEVFRKVKKDFGDQKANASIAYIIDNTAIIDIDSRTAVNAAEISLKSGLPMADSLIKATAELNNAKLITSDKHFEGLPNTEII